MLQPKTTQTALWEKHVPVLPDKHFLLLAAGEETSSSCQSKKLIDADPLVGRKDIAGCSSGEGRDFLQENGWEEKRRPGRSLVGDAPQSRTSPQDSYFRDKLRVLAKGGKYF